MFSKRITDTDLFTDMPLSTQCLYFHLNMNGDDDGFVDNTKRVQKMIGASDDDLKLLFAKEFLIPFESGVVVIKDWKIHNYIRKDTYQATLYKQEKEQLANDENGSYELRPRAVDEPLTQVRIGKDRLGEVSLGKGREEDDTEIYSNKRNSQLIKELKESSSSNLFKFYEDNGFGTLSSVVVQSVDGWLDDITDTGTEVEEAEKVVLKAMTIAVFNNARNWNYVNKILINWEQKGLNTVASIDASEKAREKNKNKGFKQQPIRKETLPNWAKSDYKEPQQETSSWTADKEAEFQKLARGE